jgi:hypothetical protein
MAFEYLIVKAHVDGRRTITATAFTLATRR